jgi:methyltransferase-like protein
MDFLRNRLFRQTLLCHKDVQLKRNLGVEDVKGLLVASSAQPEIQPVDLSPNIKVSFRTPDGSASVQTNRPLTKAGLVIMRESWPRAMDPDSLLKEAHLRLGNYTPDLQQTMPILAADLLQCYSARVVEFHTWQADFVTTVSEKPRISKLAGYLNSNRKNFSVNQRHETIGLDAVGQNLIDILDGSKDRKDMLEYLFGLTEKGALNVNRDGKKTTAPDQVRDSLKMAIEAALTKMAAAALFIE